MIRVIARCRRCRREFLMLGALNDFIDHYLPQRGHGISANAEGECGGSIQLVTGIPAFENEPTNV